MATEFEREEEVFEAEDYVGEKYSKVHLMSADEINQAALAVLNNQDAINSFMAISQERAIANTSVTLDTLKKENVEKTKQNVSDSLVEVLGDPELPLSSKKATLDKVQDETSPLYDPLSMAAAESASKTSPHEELNKEKQVEAWAKNLDKWSETTRQEQQLGTFFAATRDPESLRLLTSLADFVSGIAPFSENKMLADVLSELEKSGEIEAGGELLPKAQRAKLRSYSRGGDTLEENKRRIEEVLRLISETNTPWGVDNNTWLHIEEARLLYEDQYSTAFVEYASNTAAVLDLVSAVLPPLKLIPRALSALKGSAKTTKPLEQILKEVGGRVEVVTKEIKPKTTPIPPDLIASAGNVLTRKEVKTLKSSIWHLENQRKQMGGVKPKAKDKKAAVAENELKLDRLRQQLTVHEKAKADAAELSRIEAANREAVKATKKELSSDQVVLDHTRGVRQPTSPAAIAANTNTLESMNLHAAVNAGGDPTARAIYGTGSRDEAIHSDLHPGPPSQDGSVPVMTTDVSAIVDEVEEIQSLSGRTEILPAERELAKTKLMEKLKAESTDQVSYRPTMSTYGEVREGGRFTAESIYGATPNTGYTTVEEAAEQVLFATQKFGTEEEDLIFMIRDVSGRYVEKTLEEVRASGSNDILVKVKTDQLISYKDVGSLAVEDGKLVTATVLDRLIPAARGKLSGFAKVMESTFEDFLQIAIHSQVERTTGILDVFKDRISDFTSKLLDLSDGQAARVEQYLVKANREKLAFSRESLRRQGWTTAELDAVQSFRTTQDAFWWLENADHAKLMKEEGFGKLTLGEGSEFFGKEVHKGSAGVEGHFYNPETQEIKPLTHLNQTDGKVLYRLIHEVSDEGGRFEYVLASPKTWRATKETDKVLNYIPGYFHVRYTDPIFIKKVYPDGKEVAIATAGDTASARREVARRTASNQEPDVTFRADLDSKDKNNLQQQLAGSSGRYKQSLRKEQLKTERTVTDEVQRAPLQDPLSSMIQSADSLSQRVGMGELLRTLEARFVSNFDDLFPKKGVYPSSVDEIASLEIGQKGRVADAKVMFNWLEAQKRPDVAIADPFLQEALTSFAEALGELSFKASGKTSMLLEAAEHDVRTLAKTEPVAFTKSAVFKVFVALNPQRQISLAVTDTFKSLAISPTYVASGGSVADSIAIKAVQNGLTGSAKVILSGRKRTLEEVTQLAREFENSHLSSGIAHQRDIQAGSPTSTRSISMREAAEPKGVAPKISKAMGVPPSSLGGKVAETATVRGVVTLSEKAGFQAGEKLQNIASWLAFRQAKVDEVGRFKLTLEELDEVTAKARHYNFGQTRAAAPSYNNMLPLVSQFMSVIQKGISMTLPQAMGGSKLLTGMQKLKLHGVLLAAYGTPLVEVLDEHVRQIPEKEVRESIRGGLVWATVYGLTGADIDTKSLNAADYIGFIERVKYVVSGEWSEASPVVGVANKFAYNVNAFNAMFNGVGSEVFNESSGEKMLAQTRAMLEFFPGISKVYEAKMMEVTERNSNRYNYSSTSKVRLEDLWVKRLGLTLREERDSFITANAFKNAYKQKEQDVKAIVKGLASAAHLLNLTNEDLARRLALASSFWGMYGDDLEAKKLMNKELKKLLTRDHVSFRRFSSMIGMMDADELEGHINISGMDEEGVKSMKESLRIVRKIKEDNK